MVSVKPLIATLVLGFVAVSAVMGQNSNSGREMSVEEYFLQESNEIRMIREQARGDTEDQKLLALEFIMDAVKRGNGGEDIRASLEYLATEGTTVISRTSGRITNNYPHVRRQAVEYLGELGTPEAKDTLIKIIKNEYESMVLAEAFRSLGKIGINERDEAANAISTKILYFNATMPDDSLAYTALEAYEQLADAGGIRDQYSLGAITGIMVGHYPKTVQNRARELLIKLARGGGQSSQN
jgi:hypothetical protein